MAITNLMVSVSDSLSSISNDKSLALFNAIALTNMNSNILISKFHLTRKQFYSRISDLSNAGLIRRKKGRYLITSFGQIVYKAQELIGQALQYSSKLKVIDSINSSEFPASERNKLIDALIARSEVKNILISSNQDCARTSGDKGQIYSCGLMPQQSTS